jgi:hypothetical protein
MEPTKSAPEARGRSNQKEHSDARNLLLKELRDHIPVILSWNCGLGEIHWPDVLPELWYTWPILPGRERVMNDLTQIKCAPCRGGEPTVTETEMAEYRPSARLAITHR